MRVRRVEGTDARGEVARGKGGERRRRGTV